MAFCLCNPYFFFLEIVDRNSGAKFGAWVAGHSWTELVLLLLFNEFGVLLARLSGCSVRRPGEEVDEMVCWIPQPCNFLLPKGILRCSIPTRWTRKAWTNARQSYLQGSCTAENLSGLPSSRGWTSWGFLWSSLVWRRQVSRFIFFLEVARLQV